MKADDFGWSKRFGRGGGGGGWHVDLTIRFIPHLIQYRWSILDTSLLQMSLEQLILLVHVYTILSYYTYLSIIFSDLTVVSTS